MPISRKHNILFVHIPKNGGKTIEIIFDVHNTYEGSPNSRNKANAFSKLLLNITRTKKAYSDLMGVIDKSYTAQHLTYQEIQLGNWLDSEYLDSLIKVAVVRNPYDRAYSLFNHWAQEVLKVEDTVEEEFFVFLQSVKERRKSKKHNEASHFRKQMEYIRDVTGSTSSIFLLRLENIEEDLGKFCKRNNIDIAYKAKLKQTKYESNKFLKDKTKSERNVELVYELFLEDYELFHYSKMKPTV